ncbi:hypothetical protein OTB20_03715 [Streptomyces sp. H27-H1]|nr:hypothetical protein [Streptomyces sp. H27-H1]MCY0925326.1 hypothetical protein [Streptomyces sp. H27-H1]
MDRAGWGICAWADSRAAVMKGGPGSLMLTEQEQEQDWSEY